MEPCRSCRDIAIGWSCPQCESWLTYSLPLHEPETVRTLRKPHDYLVTGKQCPINEFILAYQNKTITVKAVVMHAPVQVTCFTFPSKGRLKEE